MTLRVRWRRKEGEEEEGRGEVTERRARRKDSGARELGVKESRRRKERSARLLRREILLALCKGGRLPSFQVPEGPEQVCRPGAPPHQDPKGALVLTAAPPAPPSIPRG